MRNLSEPPGLSPENEPPVSRCDPAARPLSMRWITNERIADTRRVWSPLYGREISEAEAVEILMNVKRFAEVLLRAQREAQQP